ncbi:LOW QUALITY PROTEIN: Hypothetical protein PHPALM_13923 [Phytophthora palmivora]|uniref:ATP-binding cassette (ABC) Superfamily n=1 Tax=Phytophthora palmivora TaxID=4796 RepID=A0A2P4XW46_9STRA|nr:LOW QUALITY PROTEIN: Hypothetical protein PHPALM_13923 [Phytophthora palmivora]
MKVHAVVRGSNVCDVVVLLQRTKPGIREVGSFLATFQVTDKALKWRLDAEYVSDCARYRPPQPTSVRALEQLCEFMAGRENKNELNSDGKDISNGIVVDIETVGTFTQHQIHVMKWLWFLQDTCRQGVQCCPGDEKSFEEDRTEASGILCEMMESWPYSSTWLNDDVIRAFSVFLARCYKTNTTVVIPSLTGTSKKTNLTSAEGKARAQAAKAASPKRAGEGAAAAKKRAAPGSPTSEPSIAKGFKSLFDSSDEEEEEGAVSELQEISNDFDEQQERYQAAQLQGAPAPPTPVYPRGYYPPDAGSRSPMFLEEHLKAPRGLNHGRTSCGAYERASVQDEPLFVNDIEAAKCVLLAPHRIPLKEITSLWKNRKTVVVSFSCGAILGNPAIQSQAEDLFWRWVSLKNFAIQELKELREDRLLSYVLDQRDLRIEFAYLIAKLQLHSVMEGCRQQSKFSAHDERGYGSVNLGTVHRKAAKRSRTTYAPAVLISDFNSHRAVNPMALPRAPPLSDNPLLMKVELTVPINEGWRSPHTLLSTRPLLCLIPLDLNFESGLGGVLVERLSLSTSGLRISLGLCPGGQAVAQAGSLGVLEILRQDVDAFGRETREFHGRVADVFRLPP